jgi:hypothetical protein
MKQVYSKINKWLAVLLVPVCLSCSDYLDIVPDNTMTIEDYFANKEITWEALSKVYSYLPLDNHPHFSTYQLGDELMGRVNEQHLPNYNVAIRVMRGLQNAQDPCLGFWTASCGARPLYRGIRSANTFLQYIDLVPDMTLSEKKTMAAQVKFLKAYFHFILLRHYGPIVIEDKITQADALGEEMYPRRQKVEDCFNYVLALMDEAIPDLKERATDSERGLIDRTIALSIKARILLFRASPFYNGNNDYQSFTDFDGQPFFPMAYKVEKWKDALEAVDAAIKLCEENGLGLFTYEDTPLIEDRDAFENNPEKMQTLYDLRWCIPNIKNREQIWGLTYDPWNAGDWNLQTAFNIRLPVGYEGVANEVGGSWNWLCADYRMLERYYTKNGLPLDEDLTFDDSRKFDLITTPTEDLPEYRELWGYMQPNVQTIQLYMNREPRFYAHLGITGGYWRAHQFRIATLFLQNTAGGYMPTYGDDYEVTGIGVQKLVHPESKSGNVVRQVMYPLPIIRMADLYLMRAEILNELQGPSQDVYDEVNKIRARAGIPDVETVYSDPQLVAGASLNKQLNKEGMREIILRERSVELAFEGIRFWDVHRYKRALDEFNSPVVGWSATQRTAEAFFQLRSIQTRRFLQRDYLWPLPVGELNTNNNLIQNPGW